MSESKTAHLNEEKGRITELNRSLKAVRIARFLCLGLGIALMVLGVRLPADATEERLYEYVEFTPGAPVDTPCTTAVSTDDIVLTIPTVRTLSTNGDPFLKIEVDYHLVQKPDGMLFYIVTSKESGETLKSLVNSESIYEGDFKKACESGATLYGHTVSAPYISSDMSEGDIIIESLTTGKDREQIAEEYNSGAKTVTELLKKYPIFDARALEPQTYTVKVGIGAGRIVFYFGVFFFALFIASLFFNRLIVKAVTKRVMRED